MQTPGQTILRTGHRPWQTQKAQQLVVGYGWGKSKDIGWSRPAPQGLRWLPRVCGSPPAGFHTDDCSKWRNSVLEKQLFQILSSQHLMKQGQDQTRDEDGDQSIASIRLNCYGSKPPCTFYIITHFTSSYHPFPTSLFYLLPFLLNLLGKVMRERTASSFLWLPLPASLLHWNSPPLCFSIISLLFSLYPGRCLRESAPQRGHRDFPSSATRHIVLKVLQKYKAWLSDLQEQEWQSEVSNRNPPSFILLPTSQVLLPQTNEEKKSREQM